VSELPRSSVPRFGAIILLFLIILVNRNLKVRLKLGAVQTGEAWYCADIVCSPYPTIDLRIKNVQMAQKKVRAYFRSSAGETIGLPIPIY
jgi:hypothetical protein